MVLGPFPALIAQSNLKVPEKPLMEGSAASIPSEPLLHTAAPLLGAFSLIASARDPWMGSVEWRESFQVLIQMQLVCSTHRRG